MRTLIEKELRENLRWLWVGLALIGSLVWYATPKTIVDSVVLTENAIAVVMLLGASLFALGLGVMQSFADLRTASRSFLFHRSVSIGSIFYSKLISGAILYFAAVGFPLCLVALWFARQGLDYLPVRPIQVLPAAVVGLACFGFHPAAMLMLARSGKWFGTKLLPLLFVFPLVLLGLSTIDTLVHGPAIPVLSAALILLGILTLVAAAKLAWVYSVAEEGNSSKHPVSQALKVTLSFAAVVLVSISLGIVCVLAVGTLPAVVSNAKEEYAMDANGKLWWAKSKRSSDFWPQVFLSGDRLQKDELPDVRRELPEDLELRELGQLFALRMPSSCFEKELGLVSTDLLTYFDSRGSVLLYDRTQNPPLQETITRGGKPFVGDPRSLNVQHTFGFFGKMDPSYWMDHVGAYGLLRPSYEVKTLVELPIKAHAEETHLKSVDNQAVERRQVTILSNGKLHVYLLTDLEGNEWVERSIKRDDGTLGFAFKEIAVSPPLPVTACEDIRFRVTEDLKFTVVLGGRRPSFLTYNSKLDSDWSSTPFRNPKNDADVQFFYLVLSLLPVLCSIVVSVISGIGMLLDGNSLPFLDAIKYFLQDHYDIVILGTVVILLSMIVTCYACHRRMLSRSETIPWCCWAVLLGLATPIAVLAIYTRPVYARCTRCEKQRRIDLRKCKHCGFEWERPAPMGIEIFDNRMAGEPIGQT